MCGVNLNSRRYIFLPRALNESVHLFLIYDQEGNGTESVACGEVAGRCQLISLPKYVFSCSRLCPVFSTSSPQETMLLLDQDLLAISHRAPLRTEQRRWRTLLRAARVARWHYHAKDRMGNRRSSCLAVSMTLVFHLRHVEAGRDNTGPTPSMTQSPTAPKKTSRASSAILIRPVRSYSYPAAVIHWSRPRSRSSIPNSIVFATEEIRLLGRE